MAEISPSAVIAKDDHGVSMAMIVVIAAVASRTSHWLYEKNGHGKAFTSNGALKL